MILEAASLSSGVTAIGSAGRVSVFFLRMKCAARLALAWSVFSIFSRRRRLFMVVWLPRLQILQIGEVLEWKHEGDFSTPQFVHVRRLEGISR